MADGEEGSPAGNHTGGGAFPWTAQRNTIREFLRSNAPPLSALYEGAIVMFNEGTLPGRERFIAHAGREICNRLPDYLSGEERPKRIDYPKEVNRIAQEWRGFPIEPSSEPMEEIAVQTGAYILINDLVRRHSELNIARRENAFRFYESRSPSDDNLRHVLGPVVSQWLEIGGWFAGHAHDSGPGGSQPTMEESTSRFTLLEAALSSLISAFYEVVEELDEILEDANS